MVAVVVLVAIEAACRRPPPPAEALARAIEAGDAALTEEKAGAAVAAYRRAVALAPTDGALRVKLAKALEQNQQLAEAAAEAMRAVDLGLDTYEAGVLAARLVLLQGRFDDAFALATRLLNGRPDDVDLLILQGTAGARLFNPVWALLRFGATGGRGPEYDAACDEVRPPVGQNRDRAAEVALRRAMELAPTSIDARIALVNFLWATRRADETEPLLRDLADQLTGHALINEVAGHYYFARGQAELGERYLARTAAAPAPFSNTARSRLADWYRAQGRFDDAITMLDGLPPELDVAGTVAILRIDAVIEAGRYDEAGRDIDALIARYPSHARALASRARLLLATNDPAGALAAADRAVSADSLLADAHLYRARALEALDDLDLAYAAYAETLRLRPAATDLPATLARVALATGRHPAALTHARKAFDANPRDEGSRLLLVEALVRTGDFIGAERLLAPVFKAKPVPWRAHLARGLLLAGRGQAEAAREAFEGTLRVRPDSIEAFTALVDLDLGRGDLGAARRRTASAVAARGDTVPLLRLLGRVQVAEGDLATAEATFRRALDQSPSDTDSTLLLAECLAARKRPDEAYRLLDQVLRRRPSSLAAQTSMGAVLEAVGRVDEAVERYEAILMEYPGAVRAAARLTVLLVTQGRNLTRAQHALDEALRVAPMDAAVNDAAGWLALHREALSEALRHLQAATRQEPRNPSYLYHLGVAFARAGRVGDARNALTQALTAGKEFPERPDTESSLSRLPK